MVNFGWTLFQPSELLKISFVLYLAAWLTGKSNSEEKSKKSLFLHFSIILIILVLVLIFQPDMSTLAIILITGGIIYFASKVPWWHVITIIGVGFSGAMLLIKISPYRLNRLLIFLNPEADPMGMGYQLKQSLIAIGSGKIFGIENGFGLGLSRQKFGFLPHPMNDSIFAIIGEELGSIGLIILLSLFLLFIWKGLNIAKKSEDNFCKLAAIGITSWIALQTMFNIGGIIGIMPMSGIPLPFFSYGGSHLITEMIGMGILLNISKNVVK